MIRIEKKYKDNQGKVDDEKFYLPQYSIEHEIVTTKAKNQRNSVIFRGNTVITHEEVVVKKDKKNDISNLESFKIVHPKCLADLGAINSIFFDKTGTLTSHKYDICTVATQHGFYESYNNFDSSSALKGIGMSGLQKDLSFYYTKNYTPSPGPSKYFNFKFGNNKTQTHTSNLDSQPNHSTPDKQSNHSPQDKHIATNESEKKIVTNGNGNETTDDNQAKKSSTIGESTIEPPILNDYKRN